MLILVGLLFVAINVFAKDNKFACPLHCSYRVAMQYGNQWHPLTEKDFFHKGIDLVADSGTDIFPAADGHVTEKGFNIAEGKYVIIEHDNGYKTIYTHLKDFYCESGQTVSTKDRIACLGNTGVSTGPHLHFAIYKDGEVLNPENLIEL